MPLLSWFVLLGCFAFSGASHFEGGTIYWRVVPNTASTVQLDWSQGWRLGAGPCGTGCNASSVGTFGSTIQGYWMCFSGCSGNVSAIVYTVTGINTAGNWEQGSNSFTYTFPSSTGKYTIGFTGFAWRTLWFGTAGTWSLQTEINLGIRSDTGRNNASPLTTFSPIYRLQYNCSRTTIIIPMLDPDGDTVNCRWANGSAECGSICLSLPNATLTSSGSTCSIDVDTSSGMFRSSGWEAGAIQVDDFPVSTITLGPGNYNSTTRLSSVPVQFLVYTVSMSVSCQALPSWNSPTPAANTQFNVAFGSSFSTTVSASSTSGSSIRWIVTSGPAGGTMSGVVSGRATYSWTPSQSQAGGHNLCFTASDTIGKANTRCVSVAVSVQCPDPGTPANMTRTVTGGPSFLYGDTITYSCQQGYWVSSGNHVRMCLLAGTFNGTAPACSTIVCPSLTPHNNATQTGTSFAYSSVVSWQCHGGYERLSGDLAVQCQLNGTWNGTALTCTRVRCNVTVPPNAHIASSNPHGGLVFAPSALTWAYLDWVAWSCDTGFSQSTGNRFSVCQANKLFNGSTIACTDINECSGTSPCANGGTCLNSVGSFSCTCVPGFSGTLCTIVPTNASAATGTVLGTSGLSPFNEAPGSGPFLGLVFVSGAVLLFSLPHLH